MADAWMWHPNEGKRLFHDVSPGYQKQLEDQGWRDSPDKVSPPVPGPGEQIPNTPSEKLGTEKTIDPELRGESRPANIRDLGVDDFRAGHGILSSGAALGRLSQFFDADGDRKRDDVPDDLLVQTVDAMSREEAVAALSQAGGTVPAGPYAHNIRAALIHQLAPGKDFAGYPGWNWSGDPILGAVDTKPQADAGALKDQNVGNGDGLDEANETARIIDPPLSSDGTHARTAPADETDQPGGVDPKVQKLQQVTGMLDDPDLTKERLQSWLDKYGISYKARDSKDELIALVRANAEKAAAQQE